MFPTNSKELKETGWDQCDIILITGDAYVDHPSFGIAVIARMLESKGYRVGIIPQPNWQDDLRDFRKLGEPRLFFGVSSGNMDSMVNHYTAAKRLRSDDAFTPGGKAGFRPDYALIEYTRILKKLFPDALVVAGGIEASLRRLVHYDYWSDALKPSVLVDSGADFLVYGMAEKAVCEIAYCLERNERRALYEIPQTCYVTNAETVTSVSEQKDMIRLASWEECRKSKAVFAGMFRIFEEESSRYDGPGFVQQHDDNRFVVTNPQGPPLSQDELDEVYDLPFTMEPHPRYRNKGEIPAFAMIQNSLTIHRGCFGGCSFCALTVHQGRFISSRSPSSVQNEAVRLTRKSWFKGHISDLGGPSANMYGMTPLKTALCRKCRRPSCIYPSVCKNLNDNPEPLTRLYRQIAAVKNVKKITIGSGIRYDIHLSKSTTFKRQHKDYLEELFDRHVSGYLKVAPEHSEPHVLSAMRKPAFALFEEFYVSFRKFNQQKGKKQFMVPYIISSHPACTLADMKTVKKKLNQMGLNPEQVQDFMPTPMTLSSVIYYSGINPYSQQKTFTEKAPARKKEQKSVFFENNIRQNKYRR